MLESLKDIGWVIVEITPIKKDVQLEIYFRTVLAKRA